MDAASQAETAIREAYSMDGVEFGSLDMALDMPSIGAGDLVAHSPVQGIKHEGMMDGSFANHTGAWGSAVTGEAVSTGFDPIAPNLVGVAPPDAKPHTAGPPVAQYSLPAAAATDEDSAASVLEGHVLDLNAVIANSRVAFLKKKDVAAVLYNFDSLDFTVQTEAQQQPPSGSLVFYNKIETRAFRGDGYSWRKKKDGKQVQEYHEKLKIGGVQMLTCCYTRRADDSGFHRRIYWLKERSDLVMVHYLRTEPDAATVTNSGAAVKIEPTLKQEPDSLGAGSAHTTQSDSARISRVASMQSDGQIQQHQHHAPTLDPSAAAAMLGGLPSMQYLGLPNDVMGPSPSAGQPHMILGAGSAEVSPAVAGIAPSIFPPLAFSVLECSPNWAYLEGGDKLLIVYAEQLEPIQLAHYQAWQAASGLVHSYMCMFGDTAAVAEMIRPGVLRCVSPQHVPGTVQLSLHVTRHHPGAASINSQQQQTAPQTTAACSVNAVEFTFRRRQIAALPGSAEQDNTMISAADEKEFYVRLLSSVHAVTNSLQGMNLSQSKGGSDTGGATQTSAGCSSFVGRATDEDGRLSERDTARLAAEQLMSRLVGLAIEHPACRSALSSPDRDGLTSLHCAGALGFFGVVRQLVVHKVCDVNAVDCEGSTAMHWACAHGQQGVVEILLQGGAKQMRNRAGLTPLDIALAKNSEASDEAAFALVMDTLGQLNTTGGVGADPGSDNLRGLLQRDGGGGGGGGIDSNSGAALGARGRSTMSSPLPPIPEGNHGTSFAQSAVAAAAATSGRLSATNMCADEDQQLLSKFLQMSMTSDGVGGGGGGGGGVDGGGGSAGDGSTMSRGSSGGDRGVQQQHDGLVQELGSLDPDIVHFVQRNARSFLERRRYERLRNTTTKMQAAVRGQQVRRGLEQQRRHVEIIQSRFRNRGKSRGSRHSKIHGEASSAARAAQVIQGYMRRHQMQQQHQKEVNAVATISDRVKLWLQIRRAVASELEDEVHSVTSESFYTSESEFSGSGPDYSDLDEFEEFDAALVIQAQVRGWMLTKKAATIIQGKVRCWLEQQEAGVATSPSGLNFAAGIR